jgi:hypothetical protein
MFINTMVSLSCQGNSISRNHMIHLDMRNHNRSWAKSVLISPLNRSRPNTVIGFRFTYCRRIVEIYSKYSVKILLSLNIGIYSAFTINKRCGHQKNVLLNLVLPSVAGSLCNEEEHIEIIT